jgi:CheY-like chemotaxis protein
VHARSVLVVEDDEKSKKLVCALLELRGYTVHATRTAAEALQLAAAHLPSLVLMDIQLPGDDGVSAMRALKDDPRTRDIPVVATTAFAMKGDRERFLGAGFSGYISKPIDVRTFPDTVASFISEPR